MGKTERTACILCSRNCGLTVEIDEGRFTRIRVKRPSSISTVSPQLREHRMQAVRSVLPMARSP